MNVINLTPHDVTIASPAGEFIYESAGVARVATLPAESTAVEGLPCPVIPSPVFGEVEGLPAPVEGTVYLVSGLVLARCAGRSDVFAPATGPKDGAIRDAGGRILAVTRLVAAPAA